MKGVILAGGLGSRMFPLTKVTNKHLLPIYNKPMIYYPIESLVEAGIDEILIVTGGDHAGDFLKILGNGSQFGLKRLNYAYQEGEGGIADALKLAEFFTCGESFIVYLGDNIVENSIFSFVENFRKQEKGSRILIKQVEDPRRFGVASFGCECKIMKITEKPQIPDSNFAVIGIYGFDNTIFDFIKTMKPSKRGELEITDVNNFYIEKDLMQFDILDGWWSDAGTFNSLLKVNNLIAKRENKL